jgi:GNAT superfamily N-acetyltransferase
VLVRTGSVGQVVEPACFVADDGGRLVGAAFVTLLPPGDPGDWDSYFWQEPPPPDCVARRQGRPHLTWIFVAPLCAGQGVGTALLAAVVGALLRLGFTQLASTFLFGNDTSMLWHWRNGFRLLPYPGSLRHLRRQIRALDPK